MKAGTAIFLGLGGVIAYTIFSKGTALKRIVFVPGNVHSFDIQGSPVMTFDIEAQNTSNQKMIMHSLAANLTCNGSFIGNASDFTAEEILPNSSTTIRVTAKLNWLGIVSQLMEAFVYGNYKYEVQVKGWANVDKYQIPLDIKFTVGG